VALLISTGLWIWQLDNKEYVANPVPITGNFGFQSDAPPQASHGELSRPPSTALPASTAETNSTATPLASGQADPFRAFLETRGNVQLFPASEQQVQQSPQAIQNQFKQALEEAKRKSAAAVVSPFGSSK